LRQRVAAGVSLIFFFCYQEKFNFWKRKALELLLTRLSGLAAAKQRHFVCLGQMDNHFRRRLIR
jgi:hypothetical protein